MRPSAATIVRAGIGLADFMPSFPQFAEEHPQYFELDTTVVAKPFDPGPLSAFDAAYAAFRRPAS
jgi:hypothetical protein